MEGGRRCPIAFLFLTLVLATGNLAAALAQLPPPAYQRYVLIAVRASEEIQTRVALRTGDEVALPGFANRTNHWFAVTGSESLIQQGAGLLLPAYRRRNIPGQGMGNLLRVLVNNNGTQQ
ncbi:unnamed protein product [Urochloa decumbens]|uniref:Uncharacterized protein n=1 Tax=Urochloa decumbens TaxID=240449 RepID=A0ABC9D017_9POAL